LQEHTGPDVGAGKIVLGIAVWAGVAVFAIAVVATVENVILGQVAVLCAVLAAWAIGERVVQPDEVE